MRPVSSYPVSPWLRHAPRRVPLAALLCALAALAVGCGRNPSDGSSLSPHASEAQLGSGTYVRIDDLQYQVQISRLLNPNDPEDRAYFLGLSPSQLQLQPGQAWFGVWMLIRNETPHSRYNAVDFEITDTQGEVFRPVALPASNQLAYESAKVLALQSYPTPESPAALGPVGGSLILFKVTDAALQNRPMQLIVRGRGAPVDSGIFNLDV